MNILALSPHTDDVEIKAGGTIARFIEEGHTVVVIAFSTGNPQTGAKRPEFEAAMGVLGVTQYELYDYQTRCFPETRQHILDRLVALRARFWPDLVLIPCTTDRHQDHQVITAEALRAFRENVRILGYISPRSHTLPVGVNCFAQLEQRHLDAKIAAISCYRSQARKPYLQEALIRALAHVQGVQCGTEFAEGFEGIRWVI